MNNASATSRNKESKPSLVSPVLAGLFSLLIPGLGQMLARSVSRGFLLLISLLSSAGLLVWRIQLASRREVGWVSKAQKAFRLEPVLFVMAMAILITYLWIVIDAYLTAKRAERSSAIGLWVLVLIVFFGLGWQIGEINLVTLVKQVRDAGPLAGRILWPWERAIHRPEEIIQGIAQVQIPCFGEPPAPSQEISGEPFLLVEPTCGDLSSSDGTPGTTLALTGRNFNPNIETEIWWQDDQGNEFRQRQEGEYVKIITDENGEFQLDIIMPYRLIPQSETRDFALWQVQARQVIGSGPAEVSEELLLAIEKMIETIFLGMMATLFGIIFAMPVSFLAARNLMSASPITLAIYFLTRTILNIIRSIEPLIWAVIAILIVGLGPFAGIVALTVHTIAALGKLYSEAIESIDPGPIEAIHATGANWLQTVVYAVVPQVIPPFVSFTIYRWDINVRMSTIIGLVGGGGIGFLLIQWIHLLDYRAVGIAVWFISITVAILDYISASIRKRFV